MILIIQLKTWRYIKERYAKFDGHEFSNVLGVYSNVWFLTL